MKKQLLLAVLFFPVSFFLGKMTPEFWIQPSVTHALAGQRIPMQLTIGENFSGERWKGKGNRILSYNHYYRNGQRELLLALAPGEELVNLPDFIPHEEGTHVLSLFTNDRFAEVPAEQFNDFLKEHGQMRAYKDRVSKNEKFKNVNEKYRRCAKVILQVGDQADQTFKEKTNLILDIIPDKNPFTHDRSAGITFKIMYEGAPLPDAMVKWWFRDAQSVQSDFLYTSPKGEVTFSAAKPGLYMISLVHTVRLRNDNGTDWQTTWSSLVFGIE